MSKRIGPEMFDTDETVPKTEDMIAQEIAPGKEVPLVATGGLRVGAVDMGPEIMVEVIDRAFPIGTPAPIPIAFGNRRKSYERTIYSGVPVALPEVVVRFLESDEVAEKTEKKISEESQLYGNKALAEATNPGMRYSERGYDAVLTKTTRRYIVRRIHPEELRARG